MSAFLLVMVGALGVAALWYIRRWIWGFPGQKPAHYQATKPTFDIRTHLSGPIVCDGVIYGPTGRVSSRFVADMEGHWDGSTGRIAEHFRYDSGSTQNREWQLEVSEGGHITATAADIIGTGRGQQSGCSVLMRYKIRLPEDAGGHVLDVTDWMYMLDNGSIINRSQFRKFGIKVAELVATLRPKDTA